MLRLGSILLLAMIVLLLVPFASSRAGSDAGAVARGKYLVEDVALCQDCHTPRTEDGALDRARWLQGGPHGFRPAGNRKADDWRDEAPAIAGLPGWLKDEDAIHFLTHGVRADGTPPLPPMKSFHMKREDAVAVVAYLRSLEPARK
ncbi:MAG: hypothetical protein QOD06_972 [Candidatus Binatota bacterium]|jgi:mono/diheme cytochrome c family protein|nr:hypothetical protein [Candidatus Binatota bacterium]